MPKCDPCAGRIWRRLWRLAVCVATVLTQAEFAVAQDAKTVTIFQQAHKAYADLQDRLNPIWIRFDVSRKESIHWQKALTNRDFKNDLVVKIDAEYAAKGPKTRSWAKVDRSDSPTAGLQVLINTGEMSIRTASLPNEFIVSKKPEVGYPTEMPWEIANQTPLRSTLKRWSEDPKCLQNAKAREETGPNGEKLLRLEYIIPKSNRTHRYWLSPVEGFIVRRFEAQLPNGVMQSKGHVTDVEEVGGYYYPKAGTAEGYLATGQFGYRVEFQVKSIKTRASEIPDSLFGFEFPKDATIFDRDRGVPIRNTTIAQGVWDEIASKAAPPQGLWHTWFMPSAVVLLIVAIPGWVYWRRKKRQSAPERVI